MAVLGSATAPDGARRTRRPRGSLSRDAILDAAEALAVEGVDTLSMRGVAARLGAVPMALYNHVATKDEMVDALLDRVLRRFEPAPTTDSWVDDLRAFAVAHRGLLDAHPWAVALLVARPNPGLGSVRIGELALGILARGGVVGGPAVAAFSGIVALNYGWASFTAARALAPAGPGADVATALEALPREDFPLTVAQAAELGAYGGDEHYALVLDHLLIGLRTTRDHRAADVEDRV